MNARASIGVVNNSWSFREVGYSEPGSKKKWKLDSEILPFPFSSLSLFLSYLMLGGETGRGDKRRRKKNPQSMED